MSDLKYSCLLFDLDGTVIDTVADCRCAINITMDHFGFPQHTDDEVRSYLNNGARMLIKRAVPESMRDNDTLIDEVLSFYKENYNNVCTNESKVYDGIYELLDSLIDRGALLGLVTNKPDETTKIMIPHFFGSRFSFVEGNHENAPPKPDKRRVNNALSALSKKSSETLFVGDSSVDVLTAKNSSVACCGVSWGFGGLPAFDDERPDYIANTPSDILLITEGRFK